MGSTTGLRSKVVGALSLFGLLLAVAMTLALTVSAVCGTSCVPVLDNALTQARVETAGFAWVYVLVLALTTLLHAWNRSWPAGTGVSVVAVMAGLTFVFGLASYVPVKGWGDVTALTWTIEFIVGSSDPGRFPSGEPPTAFYLARFLGLSATFVGAVAAVLLVWRDQIDAFRAWRSRDLDVVIGLDELTLPLIRALVAEARERPRLPDWYDPRLWDRVRAAARRVRLLDRTSVVVIHPSQADPLVAEARSIGALVVIADPADPASLERPLRRALFCAWGPARRRMSLRRLYAVSASQQTNIDALRTAINLLEVSNPRSGPNQRAGADHRRASTVSDVVPRLIVRLDDPYDAKEWRLHAITRHKEAGRELWFTDAIATDAILAHELVRFVNVKGVRTVVLVGDTTLTVALLDEIAWRRYCHHELQQARVESSPNEFDRSAVDVPDVTTCVQQVAIAGHNSVKVLHDWLDHRAPCADVPTPLLPLQIGDPWEDTVEPLLGEPGTCVIVTGQPSAEHQVAAGRVLRRYPRAVVLVPDADFSGIDESRLDTATPTNEGTGPALPPAVVRYGATLLQHGDPPEDSWTDLARQQHNWYVAKKAGADTAARRPWNEVTAKSEKPLPEFFREDNLRQHRRLLSSLSNSGFEWVKVTAGGPGPPPPPAKVILEAARAEHRRWYTLRARHGWRAPLNLAAEPETDVSEADRLASKVASERSRTNENMVDWDDGSPRTAWFVSGDDASPGALHALSAWNCEQLRGIVKRLRLWGVAPRAIDQAAAIDDEQLFVPRAVGYGNMSDAAYQAAAVTARRTTTEASNRPGVARWRITPASGDTKTVSEDEFFATYVEYDSTREAIRGEIPPSR